MTAVLRDWSNGATLDSLRPRLQVMLDSSNDTLIGGNGVDWFWRGVLAEATDLMTGEVRN